MDEQEAIRKLARRIARRTGISVDEILSECALRLPRVWELWIPELGEAKPFVMRSLQLYATKLWHIQIRTRSREHEWQPTDVLKHSALHDFDLDDADEVETILNQLSEASRLLLVARHCDDLTFLEIANALGVSKNTARNWYYAALEEARHVGRRRAE